MNKILPSDRLKLTAILCATLVLLSGIGTWAYFQHQQIVQKDRALVQQKQLKEKEIHCKDVDTRYLGSQGC